MNENLIEQVTEAAENAGLTTISLNAVPVKKMNGLVVGAAAVGGTGVGVLLMWGIPKLIGAVKNRKSKKEQAKAEKEEAKAADKGDQNEE